MTCLCLSMIFSYHKCLVNTTPPGHVTLGCFLENEAERETLCAGKAQRRENQL